MRVATITWAIGDVEPGDWILRVRSVDGRGRRATAYARFYLTILPRAEDGGVAVDATPRLDAASVPAYDGGVAMVVPPSDGCATTRSSGFIVWVILALVVRPRDRAA